MHACKLHGLPGAGVHVRQALCRVPPWMAKPPNTVPAFRGPRRPPSDRPDRPNCPNQPLQYEVTLRNMEVLENETDAMGRKLRVFKLPAPFPMFRTFKVREELEGPGRAGLAVGEEWRDGRAGGEPGRAGPGCAPMEGMRHAAWGREGLLGGVRGCVASPPLPARASPMRRHGPCSTGAPRGLAPLMAPAPSAPPPPPPPTPNPPAPPHPRTPPPLLQEANGMHPDHAKLGYVPRTAGERLAGSYINHYIANGGVVVSQFGGEQVSEGRGGGGAGAWGVSVRWRASRRGRRPLDRNLRAAPAWLAGRVPPPCLGC